MGRYYLTEYRGDNLETIGEVKSDFLPKEAGIIRFKEHDYVVQEISHDISSSENGELEDKVSVRVSIFTR